MAQFVAFEKGVEVNGQTVLAVVNAIPTGKEFRIELLESFGIIDPDPTIWYDQQDWLYVFQKISEELGSNTLFSIGKAIPDNAKFPSEINTLEKAFLSIDEAYHMNHRGGEIGYYKLVSFDLTNQHATMVCKNPYPSDFDKGIITSMLKKFKPKNSVKNIVEIDETKETRLNGFDSCTYSIAW